MNLKEFDDEFRKQGLTFVAGFDEAGRGPICGPVVAAGVIMKPDFFEPLINDSKKLTEKQREKLYPLIIENALAYHISVISPQKIDEINILEASRLGMQEALDDFIAKEIKVSVVLTDYMKLNTDLPIHALAKGDAISFSIACASILAKVTRDHIMYELDKKYPNYELGKHKGYPTKRHLELLEKYGPIEGLYRFSYAPVQALLQIKLI